MVLRANCILLLCLLLCARDILCTEQTSPVACPASVAPVAANAVSVEDDAGLLAAMMNETVDGVVLTQDVKLGARGACMRGGTDDAW